MHILLIKLKKKNILDPSACGFDHLCLSFILRFMGSEFLFGTFKLSSTTEIGKISAINSAFSKG
jgi:hypothetical protein